MTGGNGNDRGNGATTPSRSAASTPHPKAGRPDKPTDLPPLRSFRDRLPWLPWALVALLGVLVLALTLNALDFSRREQLLERRLEIATDEQDDLRDQLEAQEAEPRTTPSTSSVPPTTTLDTPSMARERELQDQAEELLRIAAELEQREADLDERESAIETTVPTTSGNGAPSFGTGVFVVGVDIPTGIYRTDAPEGCRYTKIDADDLVIGSDQRLNAGPVTMEIDERVHRVDSDECGTWTMVG